MAGINKVILVGNLGADPEIRYLENDRMRASFTVATNETYKNKLGERVTHTEWHNVVLWGPLARIAEQYLLKGKQVYVEGKLTHRSYTAQDEQTKYITEVVGQQMVLLGGGKAAPEGLTLPQRDSEDLIGPSPASATDDLPF